MNDTTQPPSEPAGAMSQPMPPPPTTQPYFPSPATAPAPAPVLAPAPAPPTASAPATKPKRRALTWVVRSVVTLVMLGLIGVSAYLVVVSQKWSERVDELTALSEDLGAEVAAERSAKEGAIAAADEVQSQLDTLKARVTDLANEEANVKDREDVLVELLDAMTMCADRRGELIADYGGQWRNSETGEVWSSRQYGARLSEECASVQTSIDEFFAEEG